MTKVNMNDITNILFVGVGGQGSLLVAELTSIAATHAGFDVKQTEVHGVSQRGGSVETHVRFGQKIFSPIITPGEADSVIALEKLEALRFAHFVEPSSGAIFVNDYEIIPGSVADASEAYPYESIAFLQNAGLTVIALPASRVARDLGDGRMANVVMIGALSTRLSIPAESWIKALTMRIPARYREGNLRAFEEGVALMAEIPEL